jgi:hypothetical protein
MTETTKQQAQFMLDQLKELDRLVHRAYFEMGRLLNAFRTHKLWEVLGYKSWREMVEEELSCSFSTASRYSHVYGHLKRLKYTQKESLQMIEVLGLRSLSRLLPTMKIKLNMTELRRQKEKLNRCIAFWVSPEQEAWLEDVLTDYGMVIENGRWEHSSEALIALIQSTQSKVA